MLDLATIGIGMDTSGLLSGIAALNSLTGAAGRAADAADGLSGAASGAGAAAAGAGAAANGAAAGTNNAAAATSRMERAMGLAAPMAKALSGVLAGFSFAAFIKGSTELAARYETMGVVMKIAGNNAGYTGAQMNAFAKELQNNGISMLQSRDAMTQLATANMDLAMATKLGRAAQDLAVVGNINSSDAMNRMITAIKAGEIEILRTMGMNVSFENSYKKLAVTLGINRDALTENQKMQARANAVLEESTRYAGIYEESLTTAGKAVGSLTRLWENLQVMAGNNFLPAYTVTVTAMTMALNGMNKSLEESGEPGGLIEIVGSAFNGAFTTALQTVMVLAVNVAHVFSGLGREIGGIAAQIAIMSNVKVNSLDSWKEGIRQAGAVRESMIADNAAAVKLLAEREAAIMRLGSVEAKAAKMTEAERIARAAASKRAAEEADELAKNEAEAAEKRAAAAKAGAAAYAQAIKQADSFIARLKEEAENAGLSADQLFMLNAARAAAEAPTGALKKAIMEQALATLSATQAMDKLTDAEKRRAQQMEQDAEQNDEFNSALLEQTYALEDAVKAETERVAAIGMSKDDLTALTVAQYENSAALLESKARIFENIDLTGKQSEEYRKQAEMLRSLGKLAQEGGQKSRDVELFERAEKESQDFWKSVDDTARSVFVNVADSGMDAFKRIGKTLKASVLDMLYQMTVKKWIFQIAGVGGSGAASAAGGGVDMLSTASNFASLANLNTAGAMGGLFASNAAYGAAIGTTNIAAGSQAAMLASQTGTFGAAGVTATSTAAAGAGSGAMASLAAAGPYIAAALALAAILGKKTPGEQHTGGFASTAGRTGFDAAAAITGSRDGETRDLIDRNNPALQDAVATGAQAAVTSMTALAGTLGQKMNLALDLGFAANTNGKGAEKSAFGYFGVSRDGEMVDTYKNRSLGEDATKAFDQLMKDATESMAKQILLGSESLVRSGETSTVALTRLSTSLTAVNEAFDSLGVTLYSASLAGADMASQLVDAFGGADAFAGATSSYFEAFYSEQERTDTALRQLSGTLGKLGLALPDAAATDALTQYRALVDAQDLNTEAGRKAYAALVTLGGGYAQLVGSTKALAEAAGDTADAIEAAMNDVKKQTSIRLGQERKLLELQEDTAALRALDIAGMDASNVALYDRIQALGLERDAAEEAASASLALASANKNLRDRIDVLNGSQTERSISLRDTPDVSTRTLLSELFRNEDLLAANEAVTAAEKALADARIASADAAADAAQRASEQSFNAQIDALDAQRTLAQASQSVAKDMVQELQGVLDTLRSSMRDLYRDVLSTAAMSAAAGRRFIDDALANARASGYMPDGKSLSDAIGAARSGMGDEQYASALDRDRDRLVLAGKLAELADIAQPQLTTAERALQIAKDQLQALDDQTRRLTDIYNEAKEQNNWARGLGSKVDALPAAIQTLQDALVLQMQAQTATLAASLVAAVAAGTARPQDAIKQFEKQAGAVVEKDKWIDGGGTQVWASAGGAMAVGGSAAQGAVPTDSRSAAIFGVQGQQTTVGDASDFIAQAMASGDPRSIYDAARAYGISSSAVDALGGFAPGEAEAWAKANGLPAFERGTNYTNEGLAYLHEGEAVVPRPYNPAAGGQSANNSARLESLVEGLTAEVQRLQAIVAAGNRHAERTATVLDDAARGKQPLSTAV